MTRGEAPRVTRRGCTVQARVRTFRARDTSCHGSHCTSRVGWRCGPRARRALPGLGAVVGVGAVAEAVGLRGEHLPPARVAHGVEGEAVEHSGAPHGVGAGRRCACGGDRRPGACRRLH